MEKAIKIFVRLLHYHCVVQMLLSFKMLLMYVFCDNYYAMLVRICYLQKSTPQASFVITLALYQQVVAHTKEVSDEVRST